MQKHVIIESLADDILKSVKKIPMKVFHRDFYLSIITLNSQ